MPGIWRRLALAVVAHEGSGATRVDASFRTGKPGPDFDVDVRIDNAELSALNDVLRAYGGFDVKHGLFSLYSEVTVREGRISGYVKPLFVDVKVYDSAQEAGKSLGQKAYEGAVGAVATVLQNPARAQVATKLDLSGKLDNPQTSTLQALANVVRNVFFKAFLPGLERERRGE